MKLNLQTIQAITLGAVRVTQEEDGIHFYRFTSRQEELYKNRCDEFYLKSFATSGIQLSFQTDSQSLFLKVEVAPGSSRRYFAFDVFVNGEKIDALDNYSDLDLPENYASIPASLGKFEKTFSLGSGSKTVCIYLPWSVQATIQEMRLDAGSVVTPVKPAKKLLCLGDSITQGYDALSPSNKYASRLARFLDAEEYNKAIGGEVFFPELVREKENFEPDYITVAYGTNDWNSSTESEFIQNCTAFFENLHANYPQTKTIVITPLWRKEKEEYRVFGEFANIEKRIRNTVQKYENMTVISGFDLVEPDAKWFGDLRLHPSDHGFQQYFENLVKYIQ